jgi:hypothetical protein
MLMQRCMYAVTVALLGAGIASGCSPAASPSPAPPVADAAPAAKHSLAVAWYVGTSTTTSPDGSRPYGPPKTVAVRRTLDPEHGTIDEYVVHPGRELPTKLVRLAGASTFEASDAARSFTGKLAFTGAEWDWDAWTYEITMTDGSGSLRGDGKRTPRTIDTSKVFLGPDGAPKARIVDHLERVDERVFEATRATLLAPSDAGAH